MPESTKERVTGPGVVPAVTENEPVFAPPAMVTGEPEMTTLAEGVAEMVTMRELEEGTLAPVKIEMGPDTWLV